MTLLSYIAQAPIEEHDAWVRINTPEAVGRCMERASRFAEAQEWGCASLWNLALLPANALMLLRLGALSTLYACLCHPQHQNHLGVQVSGSVAGGWTKKVKGSLFVLVACCLFVTWAQGSVNDRHLICYIQFFRCF